jgi:hypothetical protein
LQSTIAGLLCGRISRETKFRPPSSQRVSNTL